MVTEPTCGPIEESETAKYDKHLIVERQDETVRVPIEGVRWSFLFEGDELDRVLDQANCDNLPNKIDFTRVFQENGVLEAEVWIGPYAVLSMRETGDGWDAIYIKWPETISSDDEIEVWRRATKDGDELIQLLKTNLSPAEVIDLWLTYYQNMRYEEAAELRGCTHQAIGQNVRQAKQQLMDS